MLKTLEKIRQDLNGTPIRAAGVAHGCALVITDEELVIGRPTRFGRWRVDHYLRGLVGEVAVSPDPPLTRLQIGLPGTYLTLRFGPEARADVDAIVSTLKARRP